MASATVATPSVSTPSATLDNSERYQGHMDSITVPAPATPARHTSSPKRRKRSRPASSTKAKQSVRLNMGGPETALVVGVSHAISLSRGTGPKEVKDDHKDAIAIGLRARSHTSTLGNALAIGMGALAEISREGLSACAFGHAPKAVSHCEAGFAIAIGEGPEAAALGKHGAAVAIVDGEEPAVVSAGPEGRLVIVMPMLKGSVAFEQQIDGREFRAGRRYTVSNHGIWSELVDGEGPMSDIEGWEHPPSQVVSAA